MRTALLTDIHGNLEALHACLADMAATGVDRVVCLGDIVGYGADPQPCVEAVARLVEDGALCIRGNHDDAIGKGTAGMSESAATAIAWTVPRLDTAARAFLRGLPLAGREGEVLFVHASADRPDRWIYVTSADEGAASLAATDAGIVFSGHTHVPALFNTLSGISGSTGKTVTFRPVADRPVPLSRVRRHHAVMGSVGQPRDGDPRAAWGLFDDDAREITWKRVPYDIEAAARKIVAAGLPSRLATRLSAGR
jgi:diadenosine tetraphosphatase ApaH/serine/threonine PP2A family protein phosphatase